MLWLGLLIAYLVIGTMFLLMIHGYGNIMPPSRLVLAEGGDYRIKAWVPMPEWLWCIVLAIIWLPYIIIYVIMIFKEFKL